MYKLKGSGDVRDVLDGTRLVGRIHRTPMWETTGRIDLKRGHASFTKRRVVRWEASWGDTGQRVRVKLTHGTQPESLPSMKAWADPRVWERCLPPDVAPDTTPEVADGG